MSPGGITPPAPRTVVVVPRKQVLVVAVGSLPSQVGRKYREILLALSRFRNYS